MTEYTWSRETFQQHGITVVPANVIPGPRCTRAVATLERIKNRHGEVHARFVVLTLSDTANNHAEINETALWAVSDIVRAAEKSYPHLMTHDLERWFAFFDAIPLGQLEFWCLSLDGVISKRHALVGMIWERMERQFGDLAVQPDLLDDRRKIA